jgi:GNAT superfamily N-acetyltransferase
VLGFAYGTPWRSGSAWHDCLGAACGRALLTEWLAPSFVLTELAVTPSAQRRGLGRRLHDALLAELPQPTAVLTTPQVEMPANQLYLSAGWRVLRLDFQCEHMDQPYLVMGLDLRTRERPLTHLRGRYQRATVARSGGAHVGLESRQSGKTPCEPPVRVDTFHRLGTIARRSLKRGRGLGGRLLTYPRR